MLKRFFKKNYGVDEFPKSIQYLFFVEMGERFSFYGLLSVVTLYLISYLNFSEANAVSTISLFRTIGYASQILTIFIVARVTNHYKIMLFSLVGIAIGHVIIGEFSIYGNMIYVGLFCIFFSMGIFKPVNMPFMIKQCDGNKKLQSAVVAINYCLFNFASTIAMLAVPYAYTMYGPKAGFVLPSFFAIFAAFIIWYGKKTYNLGIEENKNEMLLFKTIKIYIFAKYKKQDWYKIISDKYGQHEAGDIYKIRLLFLVFVASVFYFVAMENMYHAMVVHVNKLEPFLFGFRIIPSQLQVINAIVPVLGLPLIRAYVLPLFFKKNTNILSKMAFGTVFLVLGFLSATIIEFALAKGYKVNATWDLIPWILNAISEIITYVYLLEFFSSYISENKRVISCVMFTISHLLSSFIISVFSKLYGSIDAVYFSYCTASAFVSLVLFVLLSKKINISHN